MGITEVLETEERDHLRDRLNPYRVYVSPNERKRIDELAKACNQRPTAYLRNVGLGYQPRSRFDKEAIVQLTKLHADQARLGGLLKLWLSEKKGEGTRPINVREVLNQIEGLNQQIARIVLEEARRL